MGGSTVTMDSAGAGGALAAQLSEDPDHAVILVEAGPSYLDSASRPENIGDEGLHDYVVEPSEKRYRRRRVVGGSFAVNAASGERATVENFADWIAAGRYEWSWRRILPMYRRLASNLDDGSGPAHGSYGPIPIRCLTDRQVAAMVRASSQSCRDHGFRNCPDWNESGASGIGQKPRNLLGEVHTSALVTYLREAYSCPNLTVIADASCLRLPSDGTIARGVDVARDGNRGVDRRRPHRPLGGRCPHPAAGDPLRYRTGTGTRRSQYRSGGHERGHKQGSAGLSDDSDSDTVAGPTEHMKMRVDLLITSESGRRLGMINDMAVFACVMEPALSLDVDTKGRTAVTFISNTINPRSVNGLTTVGPAVHVGAAQELSVRSGRYGTGEGAAARDPRHGKALAAARRDHRYCDARRATVADDMLLRSWSRTVVATVYHATDAFRTSRTWWWNSGSPAWHPAVVGGRHIGPGDRALRVHEADAALIDECLELAWTGVRHRMTSGAHE